MRYCDSDEDEIYKDDEDGEYVEDEYDEYEEYEVIEEYEPDEDDYEDKSFRKEQRLLHNLYIPSSDNCQITEPPRVKRLSIEIVGLAIGLTCILIGVVLLILGINGSINWNFKFGLFESNLENATPGILMMIIGFLIIALTNYKAVKK